MKRTRRNSATALATASAIALVALLVLTAQKGSSQEQAAAALKPPRAGQDWTAESHDRTNFPLTGKHRTLACRECHINLVFEGTPTDCEVCHWQRRQDDRYALRLGTRCSDCHTPQSWKKVDPGLWSHEVNVGYRLEGIHRTLDCETCHGSGGFSGRSTDCYSCHRSDYEGTDDPNHVQAGFPTTCASCHTQRAWEDASFSHTGFPLQGQHASLACSECHQNGVYAGTPTDCASCHQNDYNATTDPNQAPRDSRSTARFVMGRRSAAGRARLLPTPLSRFGASTPRRPAPPATPTASTRARQRNACLAISRTITPRPTPTTGRPDSRPTARLATGRRSPAGRARPSITLSRSARAVTLCLFRMPPDERLPCLQLSRLPWADGDEQPPQRRHRVCLQLPGMLRLPPSGAGITVDNPSGSVLFSLHRRSVPVFRRLA